MSSVVTEPQRQVYLALRSFIDQHHYPPTVRELSALVGTSIHDVDMKLQSLARKGHITRQPRQARTLVITKDLPHGTVAPSEGGNR